MPTDRPGSTAMTATFELETEPDVVCGSCDRPLPPGAPVGESLEAMADDKPVVLTVCVYCAMGAPRASTVPDHLPDNDESRGHGSVR